MLKNRNTYLLLFLILPGLVKAQDSSTMINENLIPFTNAEGKWGYVDAQSLAVKIKPKYDFARLFKNGVAEVGIANPAPKNYNEQNLYGLIDTTGKELFKPQFPYRYQVKTRNDSILPNLVQYTDRKGRKGIAKTDGTWMIPPGKYNSFDFYSENLIVADKHFIITTEKTYNLPKDYQIEWIDVKNKWVHFIKNDLYKGVATLKGKIVVPPEYIDISYYPKSKRFLASRPKHKLTKSNASRMLRKMVDSNDQEGTHTYLLDENGKEIALFKSRYIPNVDGKTETASFEKNGKELYFDMKTSDYVKENSVIGQNVNYHIFEKNRLKGVKNALGEVIIPAKYAKLKFFDSSTLMATNAKNYNEGLIDVHGKTVLPFNYRSLEDAGFGKLTAKKKNGYGLIGKTGKVLTDFQFRNGIYFGEDGFASVYSEGKNGVVNSEGKMVVPMKYDDIFNTHQLDDTEETYFTASKNDKWGLLDRNGKTLISFEYGYISIKKEDFKFGWVSTEDKNRKKRGAINLKTGVEIQPIYNSLKFHKNFIVASTYQNDDYKYVLLDPSGKKMTDAVFSKMDYNYGYLLVQKDKKHGVIDTNGKVLTPIEYDYIWSKNKDLVMAQKGEKYFYMNTNGKKYLPRN